MQVPGCFPFVSLSFEGFIPRESSEIPHQRKQSLESQVTILGVFLVRLLWWLQLCNQSRTRGVSWYGALGVRSSVDVPLKYHPFQGLEKCVKCWI